MDFVRVLRVLDHPQATDMIQRMIYSCPRHAAHEDQVISSAMMSNDSQEGICSRCSVVVDVLRATTGPQTTQTQTPGWTVHTLQQIVSLGGIVSGRTWLSDLSSTAVYNLLVLLELNARVLCAEAVSKFVSNIEKLPFIRGDDWCVFLIQRVRKCYVVSPHHHHKSLILLVDDNTITPHDTTTSHCITITDNTTTPHDTTTSHCITITDAARISGSNRMLNSVSPPSSAQGDSDIEMTDTEDLGSSSSEEMEEGSFPMESSPSLSTKPANEKEHDYSKQNKIKIIYEDWLASKSANQEDFNCLCSLSNAEFQRSLTLVEEILLPEAAITAISANISSLPSETSYHNAIYLIRAAIFPIVVDLKQNASRDVVSALLNINTTYPDPMVNGLVVPLLKESSFRAVHSNLLLKLLCTKDQCDSVWRGLVEIREHRNGEVYSWNDEVSSVALILLQKEVSMDEDSMRKLVELLQRNAMSLSKSSKFAKVVITLCKSPQYQKMVLPHHKELSDIATVHESILKSAVLREIRKLSKMEE